MHFKKKEDAQCNTVRLPDWNNVYEESSHELITCPEGLFLSFHGSETFSESSIVKCKCNFVFSFL